MGDAYLDTVDRLEGNLHPVDQDASIASIAISLKRIADTLAFMQSPIFMAFIDAVEKEMQKTLSEVGKRKI